MSSKRKLKKTINLTMDALCIDCLFYQLPAVDANREAIDKVIDRIVDTKNELRKRVSVNEKKDVKVKEKKKKIRADLRKQADAIAKEIAAFGQ
jgi:hypothetical protein